MKIRKRKVSLGIFLLLTAFSLHASTGAIPHAWHGNNLWATATSLLASSAAISNLSALLQAPDAWLKHHRAWTEVVTLELPKPQAIKTALNSKAAADKATRNPSENEWDLQWLMRPATAPYILMLLGMLLLGWVAKGKDN